MWWRSFVRDTGAGHNCVANSTLPTESSELFCSLFNLRLLGAVSKPFLIHCTLSISVRVGRHLENFQFLVGDTLQIYYILGDEYIYFYVWTIYVQNIYVELSDGS